jgi:hypothetical protein
MFPERSLGLIFDHKYLDSMFIRNVGELLSRYAASHPGG